MMTVRNFGFVLTATLALGCGNKGGGSSGGPSPSSSVEVANASPSGSAPSHGDLKATVHEGSVIARSPADDALYVADEDHDVVRRIALPFDGSAAPVTKEIAVAGHPAQVLALGNTVLVTVRDPGALVIMKPDAEKGLVESARVKLPADAWGVAITPDERIAIVSSAWSHKVSGIDLVKGQALWSVDVAREPRAVVVRPDGESAYVTHLVGSAVTRLDGLASAPQIKSIDLPPAPARAPSGKTLDASLAYSAALSDDGARLFVSRHALGAIGQQAWGEPWFGASTVDVLLTNNDAPLLQKRAAGLPLASTPELSSHRRAPQAPVVSGADSDVPIQPRATAYRKSARSLLVAGEGDDVLVELDALSVAPALMPLHRYKLGGKYEKFVHVAGEGGAPSGIALSKDEGTAFVWCRTTGDLAVVKLFAPDEPDAELTSDESAKASSDQRGALDAKVRPDHVKLAHLADDGLDKEMSLGRRLFFNALDNVTSGGLACAGCHPEGRDDGHVWHEAVFGDHQIFFGEPENTPATIAHDVKGVPRQTPMLAGRLNANGPYGWKAQNKDIAERLYEGFQLHRWAGDTSQPEKSQLVSRAQYLMMFAKKGLVPPPRDARDLSDQEQQGKKIFESEGARCSKCHDPNQGEYTDRTKYPMPVIAPPPGFEDERPYEFRTPSLRFIGGTAPYFHDGRAATLESLVDNNNDKMGKTNQLSKEERAALVAFLRTL